MFFNNVFNSFEIPIFKYSHRKQKNDIVSLNVRNCWHIDLKWRYGSILCKQIPTNDPSLK